MKNYEVTITRTGSILVCADSAEKAIQAVINMSSEQIDRMGNLTGWEPSDAGELNEDEQVESCNALEEEGKNPKESFYGSIYYYGCRGELGEKEFFKEKDKFYEAQEEASYVGKSSTSIVFPNKEEYQMDMLDYWKINMNLPNLSGYQIIQDNDNSVVGLAIDKPSYLCVAEKKNEKQVIFFGGLKELKLYIERTAVDVDLGDIKKALDELDFTSSK